MNLKEDCEFADEYSIASSNETISRMELALQVVGLKMTGVVEDARNVALRIVSNTGAEGPPPSSSRNNMMQTASMTYDIQPMFLVHSDETKKFEASVLKLMSVIDLTIPNQADITMTMAMSHTTASGQTLLHLAALLNLPALTEFLIAHDIDLDVRDRSGYTALHFAVLVRSKDCVTLLVTAGADLEIVNVLGKTPQDIAPAGFFDDILNNCVASQLSDGESQWGDIETDDDLAPVVSKKHTAQSVRQRSNHRPHQADEEPCNMEPLLSPPRAASVESNLYNKDQGSIHPIGYFTECMTQEIRAAWERLHTRRESCQETPKEPNVPEVNSSQFDVQPPAPSGYEVAQAAEQDVDSYGYIPVKSLTNRKQKRTSLFLALHCHY